jgi:hypothetical protein
VTIESGSWSMTATVEGMQRRGRSTIVLIATMLALTPVFDLL